MTVVGVDISTMAVHLAWVQDGRPCRWHQELGGTKVHVIDRIRAIRIQWPSGIDAAPGVPGVEVTDVAIEFPYSVNRDTNAKLMAVLGTVTRQAPPWARVAWLSSQELRAAIGAPRNTKQSAHDCLWQIAQRDGWSIGDYDEHECDALIAALGWGAILDAQEGGE